MPARASESASGARAADARYLDREHAERMARTLRTIADPTRLQLLSMIIGSPNGEAIVGELAAALGVSQPTVSHHVKIMHDDGLLDRDQRGRQVWYSVAPDRVDEVRDLLR